MLLTFTPDLFRHPLCGESINCLKSYISHSCLNTTRRWPGWPNTWTSTETYSCLFNSSMIWAHSAPLLSWPFNQLARWSMSEILTFWTQKLCATLLMKLISTGTRPFCIERPCLQASTASWLGRDQRVSQFLLTQETPRIDTTTLSWASTLWHSPSEHHKSLES